MVELMERAIGKVVLAELVKLYQLLELQFFMVVAEVAEVELTALLISLVVPVETAEVALALQELPQPRLDLQTPVAEEVVED